MAGASPTTAKDALGRADQLASVGAARGCAGGSVAAITVAVTAIVIAVAPSTIIKTVEKAADNVAGPVHHSTNDPASPVERRAGRLTNTIRDAADSVPTP